ncbi:MAG TPA: hypothetical protein VF192_01380 [Longimicrobiales bacterium]
MAGRLERLLDAAQDRLGVQVMPAERARLLEVRSQQLVQFAEEVSELGYHELGYFSGRPQEMNPEHRKNLAQKSRVALMVDPLAGAEADLRTNFALGRGIAKPQAPDEKVQRIIDEIWSDPVNQEKLFSFEAQQHRSRQLLSDANLLLTAYVRNGRVRFGFQDVDTCAAIVTDPDDEERPLYYLTARRRQVWDVQQDRLKTVDELDEDGKQKLTYWPHWRNVEDYRREIREAVQWGEAEPGEELEDPKDHGKLGPGFVYHVRINRIGRSQFGTPPFARTLRFYTAMNQLTEAQVQREMAAASIIAKNVVKGTPEQVSRTASAILNTQGELASARFGAGEAPSDWVEKAQGPGAASMWYENEQSRLEAVNLSSQSAAAAATATIVRAPIAAASQFGQHYLGDASNANLATATTLELPTLMAVGAWQETLEQMIRWALDYGLSVAARAGRLGGRTAPLPEETDDPTPAMSKTLTELWVMESSDLEELERRTGVDFHYTLEMPYPGRRNLPDVQNLVTSFASAFDPDGFNVPFRRSLLEWAATHGLQLADPKGWVDEVLPEDAADQKILDAIFQRQLEKFNAEQSAAGGKPPEPQIALQPRGRNGAKGELPKGARRGGAGAMSEGYLRDLAEAAGMEWAEVMDPLLVVNGNGSRLP